MYLEIPLVSMCSMKYWKQSCYNYREFGKECNNTGGISHCRLGKGRIPTDPLIC